ncbi:hypothetical protein TAMA11512_01400 [Selenomonas sp. TAMA-11512]|uniref:L-threonylcarbamoyladenylate synthase n=1 Tax=Selenomonas sp. TAMA-11512 TaxID=3095337 RepID=UPI00308A5A63|nr:hypothetical protein TAMA11512_01400 [Selenomonas sp. TAMA-11512]
MRVLIRELTAETFAACLDEAAARLLAGEVCALPTETVYGLFADGANEAACRRLYEVKGRDDAKPISLLAADVEMADTVAVLGEAARRLFDAFSPGPLTLILPKKPGAAVAKSICGDGGSIGIRIPAHDLVLALLKRMGRPLAATSANLAGEKSPVNASEVIAQLDGRIPLLIDGGETRVQAASTVAGWQEDELRIYRSGSISIEDARKVLNLS